jgi:hypothetical protein
MSAKRQRAGVHSNMRALEAGTRGLRIRQIRLHPRGYRTALAEFADGGIACAAEGYCANMARFADLSISPVAVLFSQNGR